MDTDISRGGGADTLDTTEKRKSAEWIKPKRNPTKKEERRIFGKALIMMLIMCMDNHIYEFENKVRLQKQGGPIGLKLTGEIV